MCSVLGVSDNNITLPLAVGLTVALIFLTVTTTLVVVIFHKLFHRKNNSVAISNDKVLSSGYI